MRRNSLRKSLVVLISILPGMAPAFGQVALPEVVETAPLATDAFSTGTLSESDGALPRSLWQGSDAQTLEYLIGLLPARPSSPSLGLAMRRALLSPGDAPFEAGPSLGGKKLLALARAGFVDEARTVASISTAGRGDPWGDQAHAVAELLEGDIASACRRNANLSSGRDELFWVKLRVLCYAQAGETDAADLTFGILRDQGALEAEEEAFLSAVVTGVLPKTPLSARTALQYAIAKKFEMPVMPGLLASADGGVLAAVIDDPEQDLATRVAAGERAVAMGVVAPEKIRLLIEQAEFDVAEIAGAAQAATTKADNPLTDALLYHSVQVMDAPEFLRDKAQRIALALSLGDSFHRAYFLSRLYADDIADLEGAILTPEEAAAFAMARMAVGDSVGAGRWLSAMIGANSSVSALPEAQALTFIKLANLLAVLDPQTAARVAGAANVSLLNADAATEYAGGAQSPEVTAAILEAAFDAALGEKTGQAALSALAASSGDGPGGEIETVLVSQALRTAGLGELQRRFEFERAWRSTFSAAKESASRTANASNDEDQTGIIPRIKPRGN